MLNEGRSEVVDEPVLNLYKEPTVLREARKRQSNGFDKSRKRKQKPLPMKKISKS
jgi:hypothetical protein